MKKFYDEEKGISYNLSENECKKRQKKKRKNYFMKHKEKIKKKRRIKNINKSIEYWTNKIKDWKIELKELKK